MIGPAINEEWFKSSHHWGIVGQYLLADGYEAVTEMAA
jgi:hypothetical protein